MIGKKHGKNRAFCFWYVIERFSSLLCSLYYYIQIWGISYNEDVYINWSFIIARSFLGETTGNNITAITTNVVA